MTDKTSPQDSLHRAQEIDARCDEFEAAWKSGERPRVETLLPKLAPADQLPWLQELLPIELFHRLKAGEQPRAEEYVARFPELDAAWLHAQIAEHSSLANRNDVAETLPPGSTHHPGRRRSASEPSAGIVVPEYELIGELGRGAMGVVYKARQLGLGRTVALKMIRSSDDAGPEELARFKSEAAAIARLQHPNIVQIYDFGEHDGRPYFSLEFIDGGTLAQKIAGVPQPPRDAARQIETLARAIHQAHVIGIVHRDLKPANVLVTSDGVLKITDFGLAKQTQADHAATATGMLLGTPQYMAPEQATGNSSLVGPAADIYALGAILYELLTGRPPFQAANLTELLQAIATREPSSPRLLKHDIPRDLETICLKCLQKLPAARYDSAATLADDLRRYFEDQPILARPISQVERAWRWCRRNPQVAIPTSALVAVLLIVSVASLIAARRFKLISDRATNSANDAKLSKLDTHLELARSRINEARMLRRSQRVGQQTEAIAKLIEARDIFRELESQAYDIGDDDWMNLRNEAGSALLVPDIVTQARWPRDPGDLPEVASDLMHQRYVVMKGGAKHAEICRIGTGEVLGNIPAPAGSSFHFGAFSDDGNHLALHSKADNQLHLWDLSAAPKLIRSMAVPQQWRSLSRDGSILLAGYDNPRSRFIRVADGQVLAETSLGGPATGFPLHPLLPWAALRSGPKLIVFDYEQQRLVWERTLPSAVINAAWGHDGRWLAINTKDTLQAFQSPTGEPLPAISAFGQAGIIPISASRAGLLVSSDWSGALRVFDINTSRQRLKTSASFFSWPRSMGAEGCFTPSYEGSNLVVLRPQGSRVTEFGLQATEYCAVSHAGNLAVAYRLNDAPGLYHLPSGELLATLPAAWGDKPLSFEAGDQALLVYGKGSLQRLPLKWTADEPPRLRIGPPQALIVSGMRDAWGMDHSGQVVAVPDFGNGGDIYHLTTDGSKPPALQHTTSQPDVRNAVVSPDGKWAVFGSHVNGKVAVYSTQDARLVRDLVAGGGRGDFSPNGEWLAVGKSAGGGELFRVSDWKSHGNLPGQWSAFSNDGSLLAVNNGISTIDIFETARLRRIAQLEIQDQDRIMPHTFTPAGDGLVACAFDSRRLLYFDLAGLRSDLKKLDLDWDWPVPNVTTKERPPIPMVEIVLTGPPVVSPEVHK